MTELEAALLAVALETILLVLGLSVILYLCGKWAEAEDAAARMRRQRDQERLLLCDTNAEYAAMQNQAIGYAIKLENIRDIIDDKTWPSCSASMTTTRPGTEPKPYPTSAREPPVI